ncbi:hypothetical protein ND440_13425 [Yersinia ruckeri]|uniref:hypothetical protein n=1 Tax=Yersinia ruckeri TaxID=29486 RepID=UPI002263FEBD|nr:hypothetical protein [Yersinia ruckeri]UZX64618.1 hypothetical protein ND440_13425 [Yersinia ruckeri]
MNAYFSPTLVLFYAETWLMTAVMGIHSSDYSIDDICSSQQRKKQKNIGAPPDGKRLDS